MHRCNIFQSTLCFLRYERFISDRNIFISVIREIVEYYAYTYTNISGNIIKHNLRTSMKERTHFFIKIYLSHFILERVYVSVVCERWVERHILRGDFFLYLLPGVRGCQPFHPLASSSETPPIGCVPLARLRFSPLCVNLTT